MYANSSAKRTSAAAVALSLAVLAGFCLLAAGCGAAQRSSVWLPTKVMHYSPYDGKLSYTTETEYDSAGNVLSTSTDWTDNSAARDATIKHASSDYDSNGFLVSWTNDSGETIQYENRVENGNLAGCTTSAGGSTSYEYYSNGVMKSQISISPSSEASYTATWDENGYITSASTGGGNASSTEYAWAFDSDGKPTSCTETRSESGTSSYSRRSNPTTTKYVIQCDSNGNITTVVDGSGNVVMTREYTEIRRPSTFAWVQGQKKSFS